MEGVNSRAGSIEESFRFRASAADYKTVDIEFVVDQLEKINKGSSCWQVGLTNKIGCVWTFPGGNAALEFCRKDDRCKVAVNQTVLIGMRLKK